MSRSVYRAPVATGARGVGLGTVGLGLAVIGWVVIGVIEPGGVVGAFLWVLLVLVAVAAGVVFATGALRVAGLRTRLVLDDDGFLNATGPRAGVRRAAWRDVRKVQADGPVVSVDLAGSRQSVIRTSALDVDPRELARELRKRLNRDRGYTPFGAAVDETPQDSGETSPDKG